MEKEEREGEAGGGAGSKKSNNKKKEDIKRKKNNFCPMSYRAVYVAMCLSDSRPNLD